MGLLSAIFERERRSCAQPLKQATSWQYHTRKLCCGSLLHVCPVCKATRASSNRVSCGACRVEQQLYVTSFISFHLRWSLQLPSCSWQRCSKRLPQQRCEQHRRPPSLPIHPQPRDDRFVCLCGHSVMLSRPPSMSSLTARSYCGLHAVRTRHACRTRPHLAVLESTTS